MANEKLIVCSFYKYVDLKKAVKDISKFQIKHKAFCKKVGIKGTILIGNEGINASISGTREQITEYVAELRKLKVFDKVDFKETFANENPFNKLIVRIKKEIVGLGKFPDISNTGKYLSPKKFNKFVEKKDVLIVDARNNYEHKIGKFENALTFDIETFREFPQVVSELEKHKDKKIVMYCTGGIRCEKASAFLKENGFKNVYQLEGGIINYINQYHESTDSKFKGRCFVFDERLSIPSARTSEVITKCEQCHIPCGDYIHCANTSCDELVIMCSECREKMNNTCSKECRNELSRKAEKIAT